MVLFIQTRSRLCTTCATALPTEDQTRTATGNLCTCQCIYITDMCCRQTQASTPLPRTLINPLKSPISKPKTEPKTDSSDQQRWVFSSAWCAVALLLLVLAVRAVYTRRALQLSSVVGSALGERGQAPRVLRASASAYGACAIAMEQADAGSSLGEIACEVEYLLAKDAEEGLEGGDGDCTLPALSLAKS